MGRAAAGYHDGRRPRPAPINMDAGHGGASGRFDRLEEVALSYAFAIRALEGFGASSS
jgi:oligopeptidase B